MRASGGAAALSVTQLSAFHEGMQRLRAQLHAAFVEDGPRLEMPLYKALCDILARYVQPFLSATATQQADSDGDTNTTSVSGIDGGLVLTYYLQDIFATLLFLLDDVCDAHDSPTTAAPLVELPSVSELTSANADSAADASEHYVSLAQRRYCTRWFFYLCHGDSAEGGRRAVPVHHVLQALYPLLDTTSSSTTAASHEALENHVVVNMLRQTRFASRRAFLAAVLHGILLSCPHGVRAVVRVLLLNDRVTARDTAEAAEYVVRLLTVTTPHRLAWMVDNMGHATRVVVLRRVEVEEQMRCLGAQLVDLFTEHAEETATSHSQQSTPSFLQTLVQHSRHASLPQETLEERLHYFVARVSNAMVQLPPPPSHREQSGKSSTTPVSFQLSYRRFFYFNKYCLTPAFALLSLRAGGSTTTTVLTVTTPLWSQLERALWRLNAILHGTALHAATQGAVLVLEAVAPGLLNLYALPNAHMPAPLCGVLNRLRRLLLQVGAVPPTTLAQILVHGCATEAGGLVKYRLVTDDNAIEPAVHLVRQPCPVSVRLQGLLRLVFDLPAPSSEDGEGTQSGVAHVELQAATFAALVEVCSAQVVCKTGVESVLQPAPRALHTSDDDESDELDVLSALRAVCMAASADALFGSRPTLMSLVTLLRRVACLSPWFLRWVAALTPKVVSLLPQSLLDVPPRSESGDNGDIQHVAPEWGGTQAQLCSAMEGLMQTLQAALVEEEHTASGVNCSTSSAAATQSPVVCAVVALQAALSTLTETHRVVVSSGQQTQHATERTAAALSQCVAQWQTSALRLGNALDLQSSASLAVELMQLVRSIEQATDNGRSSSSIESSAVCLGALHPDNVFAVLWRVLLEATDVCAVTNATRCVALLAMSRLDSPDSAVLSEAVYATLMTRQAAPSPQPGRATGRNSVRLVVQTDKGQEACETFWRTQVGARGVMDAARLARVKVRVLDVLLSLCDYDACGRTLRNVDDQLRSVHHVSLYDLLLLLCRPTEDDANNGSSNSSSSATAVVQVAVLHLIGHYVVHVYPRVPLQRVCALCHDVFRLARLEMCKAACAAMLATTATALHAQSWLAALQDVDVAELHAVASAMSTYRTAPRTTTPQVTTHPVSGCDVAKRAADVQDDAERSAADALPHDEVIRKHGRDVLALLQELLTTTLIEERKQHQEEEGEGMARQLRLRRPDIPSFLRLT